MIRALTFAALAIVAGGDLTPALADPPATLAVIPLQSERRLALYGQPVAHELETALRNARFDVVLIDEVTDVPTRAWLVVDGRLVRTGGAVTIELRIRDPEHAIDVARLASKPTSLGEIDRATQEIAAQLVAIMERERALLTRPVAPAPIGVDEPGAPIAAAPAPAPRPAKLDRRPVARLVVVGRAMHDRGGAALDVVALGMPAAVALAARLGYQPATSAETEVALTITVELVALAAGFEGAVPVGRARARVKVADRAGASLFDRVVRTDTVVGSRGDRVDTLIRLVAAQVTDVVAPRIRERLGTR